MVDGGGQAERGGDVERENRLTSVKWVISRSTDMAPGSPSCRREERQGRGDQPARNTQTGPGSSAGLRWPHAHQVTLGLLVDLPMIIELPPLRTPRRDRRQPGRPVRRAYSWALFSPPSMVAITRPGLAVGAEDSATRPAARSTGGHQHVGEASSRAAMSAPTAQAGAAVAPAGSVTVMSSCWSLWPNFSLSSCATRAGPTRGPGIPPEDRCSPPGCRRQR